MSDKTNDYHYKEVEQGYLISYGDTSIAMAVTSKEIFAVAIVDALNQVPPIDQDRMKIAAMAMASMVAGPGAQMVADRDQRYDETNWKEVVAKNACEFADALLSELSKPKA